jgi:glutamate racemase
MIVMDSGLGGISVVRALRAARPGLALTYIADTAGFPYGKRGAESITVRAGQIIRVATASAPPSCVVLACNTLSTLCLAQLRAAFPFPFVGTVPAIKVAARDSASRRFTLLATPNTAHSAYSHALIDQFAQGCVVDCYGAPNLAVYAERMLLGEAVDPALLTAELAPAFHDDARGRTDAVVLGCTHYPLILDALRGAAPWAVQWIDSGEAIARRALAVEDTPPERSVAYVTAAADVVRYHDVFRREGFDSVELLTEIAVD